MLSQEKPRNAEADLFGLKFAKNIHYKSRLLDWRLLVGPVVLISRPVVKLMRPLQIGGVPDNEFVTE